MTRIACSGRARGVLDYIDRAVTDADRPRGTLTLPLAPNIYAYLEVPRVMHTTEWELLMDVLEAFRPGLVSE